VSIRNVVQANLQAAEGLAEKVAGKVFNIGAGQAQPARIARRVEFARTDQQIQPNFRAGARGDVRSSQADIIAAKKRTRL